MTGPAVPAHPRDEFDGYAQLLDLGRWRYEVDDYVVPYGTGRWFPFQRGVRLAPDLELRAWRTEYVLLWPGPRAHQAHADLTIALRPAGMGAAVVRVTAVLDLRGPGAVTLRPQALIAGPRPAALIKAGRVLELVRRERRRRRTGRPGPLTAHERHHRPAAPGTADTGPTPPPRPHDPRPGTSTVGSGWSR